MQLKIRGVVEGFSAIVRDQRGRSTQSEHCVAKKRALILASASDGVSQDMINCCRC